MNIASINLQDQKAASQSITAPAWTFIACGIFAVFVFFAILTERCLYADGSYVFLKTLVTEHFVPTVGLRAYICYLYEVPVIVALKMGVTSIPWLAIAYGIGCFGVWPLAMFLCYRMAPQHFWLVMLACAAGYLNAAFMAMGEHIGTHALFWTSLFAILYVRPLTPLAAVTLLVSTIILVQSYESMLFLGPPMIALLVWRVVRDKEKLWQQAILVAAAVFLAAATNAAWEEMKYPNQYYGTFKQGFFYESLNPPWTLMMSYCWFALAICAFYKPFNVFLKSKTSLVLIVLFVLVWGLWPLLAPDQLNPESQYKCRFLELLVPLALMPVAIILAEKPNWFQDKIPDWTKLAAIMLIAQSLWQVSATWQWQGYIRDWNKFLAVKNGPVFLNKVYGQKTSENGQALCFDWPWANPCMSLIVGPRQVRSIVMPEYERELRFDPLNSRELPNLKRYGVDYTDYITALNSEKLLRTNVKPIYSPLVPINISVHNAPRSPSVARE